MHAAGLGKRSLSFFLSYTPLRDAPNIRANLPGLQTELRDDGFPSKCTRSTKRSNSRSMPQKCSQGILGLSVNYNGADYIYADPDHFYTEATSQNGAPSVSPTHSNTLTNSQNARNGRQNRRKQRKHYI
eukprot:1151314-Pelagomonas_calceolata.AAC.3